MAYESEYKVLKPNENLEKRKEYWEIAKGLQKVDGLTTSGYLEKIIEENLNGTYETELAGEKIKQYYDEMETKDPRRQHEEADIVASRITISLERGGFKLSPIILKSIHKELFADVLPFKWVGQYREENITKAEDILNGQTVDYAGWHDIPEYLSYDFDQEIRRKYEFPFAEDDIKKFAKFISAIWQTHPFREGNTRTISTFLIKYLKSMGIEINNKPFQENAKWFRDSLVRSNYSNIPKGIRPDFTFVELFFENVILGKNLDFCSIDLRCKEMF